MDCFCTIKLAAVIFLITAGVLCAEDNPERHFWSPELPGGQAFMVYPRSIKSFRLAKYDIHFEGERYPVTELNLELTHGVARFLYIGSSEGKLVPLSVKEIADGNYGEKNSLKKRLPSSTPPEEIKTRGRESQHHCRFLLESSEAVEKLHHDLSVLFSIAFPW